MRDVVVFWTSRYMPMRNCSKYIFFAFHKSEVMALKCGIIESPGARPTLAFPISLQNEYLYRRSQYPKMWIGKCHTPILSGQRLRALDYIARDVIEGSWVRVRLEGSYFPLHKIRLVQEQLCPVENGCCCPRMVGISYVNLYKTK